MIAGRGSGYLSPGTEGQVPRSLNVRIVGRGFRYLNPGTYAQVARSLTVRIAGRGPRYLDCKVPLKTPL